MRVEASYLVKQLVIPCLSGKVLRGKIPESIG